VTGVTRRPSLVSRVVSGIAATACAGVLGQATLRAQQADSTRPAAPAEVAVPAAPASSFGQAQGVPTLRQAQGRPEPSRGTSDSRGTQATTEALRAEVARLKQELETLSREYGDRLAALESKLGALEGQPAAAAPAPPAAAQAPATVAVPAGAAGAGGPEGALPVYGNVASMSKIFNPDIAVIGNVTGAVGKNQIDSSPALQLQEAEASFQAVVDPYARADFFLGFSPDGVEIEEGFVTFNTLPGGLLMKAGKMYGQFGKVNTMHTHMTTWVDRPLVASQYFGGEGQFSDAGISVSKLVLNPWVYLEATGEVYGATGETFVGSERSDLLYVGRLRGYRDVSDSMNLDLGTSVAYGPNDARDGAHTRLVGIDATFRYRPLRRAIYKRALARTELIWNRRDLSEGAASTFGMYASGEYQFARRWFGGVRYDYSQRAYDASLVDYGGSLILTYWPSEFSQIRGQYRRTRYAEQTTANEFLFQFQFSIGAHGAHAF